MKRLTLNLTRYVPYHLKTYNQPPDVVELGSGNSVKAGIILRELLNRFGYLRYFPIDISPEVQLQGCHNLLDTFPNLDIQAISGEYLKGLDHLKMRNKKPRLILWLGSSIGNFDRNQAVHFLKQIRNRMNINDKLLVGIDFRKESKLLVDAYNDTKGITANFNLNLLIRINREFEGTFEIENFFLFFGFLPIFILKVPLFFLSNPQTTARYKRFISLFLNFSCSNL